MTSRFMCFVFAACLSSCSTGADPIPETNGGNAGAGQATGGDTPNGGGGSSSGAATGGSQITMRFTTFDAGDGVLDATTLIDDWRWTGTAPGSTSTEVL